MKNKKDIIFILIMASLVGVVLVWFPINHLLLNFGYKELQTTDNWVYFEYTKNGLIGKIDDFFESKKTNIQNRVTNYFPFYHNITSSFYNNIINANSIFYKNDVPIGTNSDGEYVFFNNENSFYYLINNHSREELNERVKNQYTFFNDLYESNDNVNLNIYFAPRYEQTNLYKNNLSEYVDKFITNLDENINVDYLNVGSIDEYNSYFYKTDHHWTIFGAYQGYKDIMSMLGENSLNLETNIVKNEYYGSLAKSSMSKLTNDSISDVRFNSNLEVYVNGEHGALKYKPREITYNNDYDFFDYYVHYFNGQYGLVKFVNNNDNNNKNLLIFSDSYGWQIDYLIANNYKNTYVINLRYDEYQKNMLNYSKFIDENNISDVLFLYEGSALIYDAYDYNFNKKIVEG